MTLRQLRERLDALSWAEHVDFEATERGGASEQAMIDREVRALAKRLTPALLDALSREAGYEAWARRLRALR